MVYILKRGKVLCMLYEEATAKFFLLEKKEEEINKLVSKGIPLAHAKKIADNIYSVKIER